MTAANTDTPPAWAPPRCSHGRIILGCPDGDCPEQNAYLASQNAALDVYYTRQRQAARRLVRSMLGLPTRGR